MDTNVSDDRSTWGGLLAEASKTFYAPESIDDTLMGITTSAVELIRGAEAADILILSGERYQSHAPTSELPVRIDALQERLREGPCVDAARRDPVVRSDDLTTDERWPRFSPGAVEAGVRCTLSFQLYVGESSVGGLNLFSSRPGAFDDADEELGLMFATHAAIALYSANKTHQFTSALASRDIIGQAKGMIMERFKVDAVRAFELLAKLSQDQNVPVAALAADLVRLGPDGPRDE